MERPTTVSALPHDNVPDALNLTARRATSPPRGFTPAQLGSMPRDVRRTFMQSLIAESGARVLSVDLRGEHDDFVVETPGVWRSRQALVRVIYRAVKQLDIDDVEAVARDREFADATLVEAASAGAAVTNRPRISVIRAHEFIERLEASAIVQWQGGSPVVDRDRYALVRSLEDLDRPIDALGLRWLTSLSLNKVPQELDRAGLTADALFERMAFRSLTMVFRFGGIRLGQRATGVRAPDALIASPAHSPSKFAALLDCKSARDGYVMTVHDERALLEYIPEFREQAEAEADGAELRYVVVLSSSFPGEDARKDPYLARASALSRANVTLVYLTAAELVNAAITVEQRDLQTRQRESIDWEAIFDQGRVPQGILTEAIPGGLS